jgi:hypothetical protein
LLRLGLPRDPAAVRHVLAFLVSGVVTVLVTRGLLAAAGYPKVGGKTLHLSHVLWGGLLMAIAFVLLLSYLGPVVRPVAAIVGGVGFGLFADEIGKFVTADYNYFYAPTAALVYLAVVVIALVAEALHGRRSRPVESLAAAVDQAVSGVAGGFSARTRARADALVDAAGDAAGVEQTRALLDSVADDHAELPDPTAGLADQLARVLHAVVRERWVPVAAAVALLATSAWSVWRGLDVRGEMPGWLVGTLVVSAVVVAVACVVGLVVARRDRRAGLAWCRRAALVGLLVTQVALFRVEQWAALGALVVDLVALGVLSAEIDVLRRRTERPA